LRIRSVLTVQWDLPDNSAKGIPLRLFEPDRRIVPDGHVRAFEAFGGVPIGMIGYDNLKPAVAKTWFAGLLRDGFSLTVDETNPSFASLGAGIRAS
jgi:hypothetical protein